MASLVKENTSDSSETFVVVDESSSSELASASLSFLELEIARDLETARDDDGEKARDELETGAVLETARDEDEDETCDELETGVVCFGAKVDAACDDEK